MADKRLGVRIAVILAFVLVMPMGAVSFAADSDTKAAGAEAKGAKQAKEPNAAFAKAVDRALANYMENLSLTEEQQKKVRSILEARRAKRLALVKKHRETLKALQKETDEKFAGVLTPEQVKKLEEMKKERRDKRAQRMKGSRK